MEIIRLRKQNNELKTEITRLKREK
jgi:hypothetical protein